MLIYYYLIFFINLLKCSYQYTLNDKSNKNTYNKEMSYIENNNFDTNEIIEVYENMTISIDFLQNETSIKKIIKITKNNTYPILIYIKGASDILKIYNGTENSSFINTNIYLIYQDDLIKIDNLFTLELFSDRDLENITIYIQTLKDISKFEHANTPNNYNIDLNNFKKITFIYTTVYEQSDYVLFFNQLYGYCTIKYYTPLTIEDDIFDDSKYSTLYTINNLLIHPMSKTGNLYNIQCTLPSYVTISYALKTNSLTLNNNQGHLIYVDSSISPTLSYSDISESEETYSFNFMTFNQENIEFSVSTMKETNYLIKGNNMISSFTFECSQSSICLFKFRSSNVGLFQMIKNYNSFDIVKIEKNLSIINHQYIYLFFPTDSYYKMTVGISNIKNDFTYQLFTQYNEKNFTMYNIPYIQSNNFIEYESLPGYSHLFHFINPYDLNVYNDKNYFYLSIAFTNKNIINNYTLSVIYSQKPVSNYTISPNEIKPVDSVNGEIELKDLSNPQNYIVFIANKCSNPFGLKFSYYGIELFTKIFESNKNINSFIIERKKIPKTMQIQALYNAEKNVTINKGYAFSYIYTDNSLFNLSEIDEYNSIEQNPTIEINKNTKKIKVRWKKINDASKYHVYITKNFEANDCYFLTDNGEEIKNVVTSRLYANLEYSGDGTYYIYVYAIVSKIINFRVLFVETSVIIDPKADFTKPGVIIRLSLTCVVAIIIFGIIGIYLYRKYCRKPKKINPMEYSEGYSLAENPYTEGQGDLGVNAFD